VTEQVLPDRAAGGDDDALPDSRTRRWPTGLRPSRVLPPLVVLAALVAAWQLYSARGGLGPDVLPGPWRVASAGWAARATLWQETVPTVQETLLGFSVSVVTGFVLSVAIDRWVLARRSLTPVLIVSQTLPLTAIAPLAVILLGFGLVPKVALVTLVTFFPVTIALVEGYASADRDAQALLASMGAGRWRVFRSVRLPSAMPFFFAGLRIAITYAVVAAIFAEYAGAYRGLGIFMQSMVSAGRTDLELAAVFVSAALTLALYGLTFLVERVTMPWLALQRASERAP